MTGRCTRWERWLPGSGGRLKVLIWNLHSFKLSEIIQVLDSISWVRCASGNVLHYVHGSTFPFYIVSTVPLFLFLSPAPINFSSQCRSQNHQIFPQNNNKRTIESVNCQITWYCMIFIMILILAPWLALWNGWYAFKTYFKTHFYSSCGDKTIIMVISKVSIMVEKIFVKRPNIQFPRLAHEGIHHPLFALSSSPFHFICQMLSKY